MKLPPLLPIKDTPVSRCRAVGLSADDQWILRRPVLGRLPYSSEYDVPPELNTNQTIPKNTVLDIWQSKLDLWISRWRHRVTLGTGAMDTAQKVMNRSPNREKKMTHLTCQI